MKLYLVCEIGYEYNDEYYDITKCDSTCLIKAYKSREKAVLEMDRLNRKRMKEWGVDPGEEYSRYEDSDRKVITQWYEVREIKADLEDIV